MEVNQATPIRNSSIALGLSLAVLLAACSRPQGVSAPAAGVSAAVRKVHEEAARAADLSDPQAFAEASRGFIAAPTGQVRNADGAVVWDFGAFDFVKGPPPDTVNPSLWRQARLNNQVGLFKVADGIHQLRGFDLANITLIDGETGWIVVDTLTSRETAAAAMAFARRHLGDKKVSAVIFTHSHIDHFGGALGVIPAQEVAQREVPVVAPVGFMEEATSENVLMGPAMGRRAMYMYGSRLDRSALGLVDEGLGKSVAVGSVGILAPNRIVDRTPQEMTIDGVRLVFQNVPGSEAPAELTFYLPQLKAYCGAEMLSHTMHNLYTLRGAKVRDALKWADYIDQALTHAADAEVYFGSHHWPVWGKDRIAQFMTAQRDVYRYTHDQTVRMMNAGLSMREVAEQIRLPKALDAFLDAHGYYGTLRHNAKAVYQFYLGWFDANPANLDPLPPREAASRYMALAGGEAKAVAAAQAAFDQGDLRWTAELLSHVVLAAPGNADAKQLLARTYDQLGWAAESAPWRNFYLTGAYELRNGPPKAGIPPSLLLDMLAFTPVERFLEAMAGALNGPRAEGVKLKVNLVLSDTGESYVLQIDNAVLHQHRAPPAPDAGATLTLTKAMFLKLMTGTAGVKDTLMSDDLAIAGSRIDLLRFFALFDKAHGVFPIVTRE